MFDWLQRRLTRRLYVFQTIEDANAFVLDKMKPSRWRQVAIVLCHARDQGHTLTLIAPWTFISVEGDNINIHGRAGGGHAS